MTDFKIINATKDSSLYFFAEKRMKANYIILCEKDCAYYITSKKELKKVVNRENINKDIMILSWDSDNKRYDLYKLKYCL